MKDRRYQKKVSKKVLTDTVKFFVYGYTVTNKSGKTIEGKDIIKRNKAGWRGNCQLAIPVAYVMFSF